MVTVTGDVSEDDPAQAAEVQRLLTTEILPRLVEDFGIGWRQTGLAEQEGDFLSDAVLGLILCLMAIYLVLSWIFASWTRPLVVMSVIPFGVVGAIWGHYIWDTPLSMFSVVGLIGMSGIIINDSIVLVGAIDEHAQDRPLSRAIVEGAADRLRAVTLTTLTTVLGLAPLLYETSSQALFLKPTVITLAYGLGFGMVLVLVVVPAVMAVQSDVGRTLQSLRRGLFSPRRTSGLVAGSMLAMLVAFSLTLGRVVAGFDLPAGWSGLLPGWSTPLVAGALFLGFVAVLVLGAALGVLAARAVRAQGSR